MTARQGILSLAIKEKNALYAAYMPFVEHGGLFIPTSRPYKMGEKVFVVLQLMDETEKLPISAKVIWVTPEGADGYRIAGVGVQFSEQDGVQVKNKIENYLAEALKSNRSTHTM
jgi:type IV pilus assembly protein PilZ